VSNRAEKINFRSNQTQLSFVNTAKNSEKMAKIKIRKEKDKNPVLNFLKQYATVDFVKSLIFDPSKLHITAVLILIGELILNVLVVNRVNYTEIDWIAYMQECEGFLNGTTNYAELRGE
jgi:alpha-1,3-mannosyltransferase